MLQVNVILKEWCAAPSKPAAAATSALGGGCLCLIRASLLPLRRSLCF